MCGIFAYIQRGTRIGFDDVVTATNAIRHRGPDDEGYVLVGSPHDEPLTLGGEDTPADAFAMQTKYAPRARSATTDQSYRIGLGHRRLSIVDLSAAGHQPMCDDRGAVWITYNGEIYNYPELRTELEQVGFQFRTETDTEVVLAAYRHWGEACLEHFNGMWAFVIIDRERQTVFASGDRFAIKPLYIWTAPSGNVFFASEMKQFQALPEWSPALHAGASYEFLAKGRFNHIQQSLVQSVLRLRGGEKCSFAWDSQASMPTITTWYELPTNGTTIEQDADAVEQFHELFVDAIRLRLRADVKVGSCLSGGLDSSSIVCIVNDLLRESQAENLQETISSCYADPRFDERDYINRVVGALGVNAHYVFPTVETLLSRMTKLAWQMDGPFVSGSVFSQWNVFAAAKEHGLTVMLDGQGADEQLGGYHKYFIPLFTELLRSLQWIQYTKQLTGWCRLHASASDGVRTTTKLLLAHRLFGRLHKVFGNASTAPSTEPVFRRLASTGTNDDMDLPATPRTLDDLLRNEIRRTSLPRLLHYEDRNSMAHSIEARVPFLDYRLVEFMVTQPTHRKIRAGETKFVLREAMRGTLPEEVRTRQDKMGFVSPEEVWMRGPNSSAFRDALATACERCRAMIDGPTMLKHFDAFVAGDGAYSTAFWRAISFGDWTREFGISTS